MVISGPGPQKGDEGMDEGGVQGRTLDPLLRDGLFKQEVGKGVSAMLTNARVSTENIWVRHILQNTNMIQNQIPSS